MEESSGAKQGEKEELWTKGHLFISERGGGRETDTA